MLARIGIGQLEAAFPPRDFTGNANGGRPQDSNGRPNTLPYAFTVRVVVRTVRGTSMSGEDRRQLFLHRDGDLLPHFPIELHGDGDSSPLLADIDGDNRNELIVATSDGFVTPTAPTARSCQAGRSTPISCRCTCLSPPTARSVPAITLRCWERWRPVTCSETAGSRWSPTTTRAMSTPGTSTAAWCFTRTPIRIYSGAPLRPFDTVRQGVRDRTEPGFLSAPVLASLDGGTGRQAGRGLDIIAASEDRHVYAWHADGRPVAGFPVLVVDPDKVATVDPVTNHVTFKNVDSNPGLDEDQGKIVDTPAVADINGGHPSIIVGTNEEYPVGTGDEGAVNINPSNPLLTSLAAQAGQLKLANGRVYAIKPDGTLSGNPFLPGWPHKLGLLDAGLLPDVGEGINGSPVVAPLRCPSGGTGLKIGVTPDAGPAYILNPNGSSCYGVSGGADNTLATAFSPSTTLYDTPVNAAVGYPAFGTLDGRNIDFFAPATGLFRAI